MVSISESLDLQNSIILLKLARFVSKDDQHFIRQDLINIIPQEVDIRPDPWARKRRIILKVPNTKIEDAESLLQQISQLPGILTIIIFKKENFDFSTDSLSELVKYTLSAVRTIDKPLRIKFQAIGSLPFHKKAFLDRIRKKKTLQKEPDERAFNGYIECTETDSHVLSRLGYIYHDENIASQSVEPVTLNAIHKLSVILFSPYTAIEIADFCRISLNFDFLEIIFSNENEKVPEVLEETSKTLFKGLDKVSYKVIPSLNNFIGNNREKYSFLGFSLHAIKNVQELKRTLKDSNKTPCVIIGNEVRGLEYSTQKMIDMFKLGTGSSEPLRASHVLAYVLGMIA